MTNAAFESWVNEARAIGIASVIFKRGVSLRKSGAEFIGPCPKCGGNDRFSINTTKNIFNCRGCGNAGDVIALVEFLDGCDFNAAVETLTGRAKPNGHDRGGGSQQHIAATYNYVDASGVLVFQVVRFEPKGFRQRRPNGQDWIWNLIGVQIVPYRYPELIEAIACDHLIFMPEGEKDVENLIKLGVNATCNPMGAGKWSKCQIDDCFRDAHVVIIADNDPVSTNKKTGEPLTHPDGRPRYAGWDHANEVARHLFEVAIFVKVIDLKAVWQDCPDKGDISDWIKAGGTIDQLHAIVDATAEWQPGDELKLPANAIENRPAFIQSSAEFVRDFLPPDYLINRVLQRRFVYAFTGKTGSGKTAVVLYLAACVALSRKLGDLEISGGRVLYLAGENPDDVRMRWIAMSQQMDFDCNMIGVYFIPGRFKISEMRERIVDELNRIGDIVLVVIDTSAAYYEGKEVNSNTEQAEHARMMRTLVGLPGGPCVLINCHPIKNATPDNLIPLGAGSFLNEVDGNLTCQINDRAVEVHWQGKIRGQDFAPLLFKLKTDVTHERLKDSKGYEIKTVVAELLTEAAKDEIDKAANANLILLLRAILEDGKASIAELGMRCGGWPKPTAQRRLNILRGKSYGFVSKQDLGTGFTLTEKGKKYLEKLDGDLFKAQPSGLIIIGDCSKHAHCKLCNGTENVKRIRDNAIADCPVETLHEKCAAAYFARKKDMPLS